MRQPFVGLRGYLEYSRLAGSQEGVSALTVLRRLVFARVVHKRGIKEFDTLGFARRPVRDWLLYQPYEQIRRRQERVSRKEFRAFDEDKLLFAAHCRAHDLPTPSPVALLPAAASPDPGNAQPETHHGVPVIRSGDALTRLFSPHDVFDGFAKPAEGGQGWGAFGFLVTNGRVRSMHGEESVAAFHTRLTTSAYGHSGYLLQPRLRPHPELAWGMQGPAVGTVRIVTGLRPDGSVNIVSALLFLVPEGAVTDKPRDGGYFASVNVATGAIGVARGRPNGARLVRDIECMPDQRERFVGRVLPCWPETLALVERAARAFPMLPALGWDVAITPTGPELVETNWQFGTSITPVRQRPGDPSMLDALFDELAQPRAPDRNDNTAAADAAPFQPPA